MNIDDLTGVEMFDDNSQTKPAADPVPADTSAAMPTISAPSVPVDAPAVATADTTMSSGTAMPTDTGTYNNATVINDHASMGPSADPAPMPEAAASSAPAVDNGANDDLVQLKQQALQSLSPLLSHLDQTPEEKFRTTMMMIQASDNQALVKDAFEAAQNITDEKAKAQALLDVVNEINYFTQHGQN